MLASALTLTALSHWGCAPPDPEEAQAQNAFLLVTPPRGHAWTFPGQSSASGAAVVGFSGASAGNALRVYRWTAQGGERGRMTWLQPPAVDPDAPCNILSVGVSADGTALLGTMYQEPRNTLFFWNEQAGMTDLGPLPGQTAGDPGVRDPRLQISRDGEVVMAAADGEAFRWTRGQGRVALGTLPGDLASEATSMSADGRVIAGDSRRPDGSSRVFRWTAASGLAAISAPTGSAASSCRTFGQLSDDGKVLFGGCARDNAGSEVGATTSADDSSGTARCETLFRWTAAGGAESIAIPAGFSGARPWAATSDGSTLLGTLQSAPPAPTDDLIGAGAPGTVTTTAITTVLFRWTKPSGLKPLSPPRGFTDCAPPMAISADGDVVVATCRCAGASRAVKWDADGRAATLEAPAGFAESHATSVSADGNLVAGYARQRAGTTEKDAVDTAVVWENGRMVPQRISELLRAKAIATSNLDVDHLRLSSAQASADGHTLFGEAIDPQGHPVTWIARWQSSP